jgi:hypothetical protein
MFDPLRPPALGRIVQPLIEVTRNLATAHPASSLALQEGAACELDLRAAPLFIP